MKNYPLLRARIQEMSLAPNVDRDVKHQHKHYETVLLSTQNICLNSWISKLAQFPAQRVCLSEPTVQSPYNTIIGEISKFPKS